MILCAAVYVEAKIIAYTYASSFYPLYIRLLSPIQGLISSANSQVLHLVAQKVPDSSSNVEEGGLL